MKTLRACYDWRVITALAAVGLGVLLFAPNLIGAALPLLFLAACPLSMLVMMKMMGDPDAKEAVPAETGPADRAERLRTELAASRREQQRLARELEGLDVPAAVANRSTEPASSTPA